MCSHKKCLNPKRPKESPDLTEGRLTAGAYLQRWQHSPWRRLSCRAHHVIRRRRPLRPPQLDQRSSRAGAPCRCTTFPLNGLCLWDAAAAAAAAPPLTGMRLFRRARAASRWTKPKEREGAYAGRQHIYNVTSLGLIYDIIHVLLLTPPPRVKGIPPTPSDVITEPAVPPAGERGCRLAVRILAWVLGDMRGYPEICGEKAVEERGRLSASGERADARLRNAAVLLSVFKTTSASGGSTGNENIPK